MEFRAFDTELNRYVDTGEIIFSFYGDTTTKVYPNEQGYPSVADYQNDVLNGRFIVEEYTGLKDQIGVDIYEGDVLSDKWLCVVYRDKNTGAFMVYFGVNPNVNKPTTLYLYLKNREKAGTAESDNIIICTIHENPELIPKP